MKTLTKYTLLLIAMAFLSTGLQAQTSTIKKKTTTTTKTKTTTTKKAKKPTTAKAPTVIGKEVTINIKNNCEKQVAIYTGSREGLRTPKIKMLGGSSTDKIYVHINEVVCVMSADGKKPVACKDVKATTTTMEVNSSATQLDSH